MDMQKENRYFTRIQYFSWRGTGWHNAFQYLGPDCHRPCSCTDLRRIGVLLFYRERQEGADQLERDRSNIECFQNTACALILTELHYFSV